MPTPINQVPILSQARNPRALITLNGIVVRKLESITYIENNYYQPDTFRIEMPLYNLIDRSTTGGAATGQTSVNIDIEYLMSQQAIMCEIFFGFPSDPINYGVADLTSMMKGAINTLDIIIFEDGRGEISFDGFDLSKLLIDKKTLDKYPNKTASEIAQLFAEQAGLGSLVTTTSQFAGYYYNQDYVQLGNLVTQWDLLTFLAEHEGYLVFVRGNILHFQPKPTDNSTTYLISGTPPVNEQQPILNGNKLMLSRNFNYARDVKVTVLSWNAKTGKVSETFQASKTKKGALAAEAKIIGQPQQFTYRIPGLSKQAAITRATQLANDITLHERNLMVALPGDNLLRKDVVILLQGVSTSVNQTYFPDTITRTFSTATGYQMEVIAKNHSPQSVVAA